MAWLFAPCAARLLLTDCRYVFPLIVAERVLPVLPPCVVGVETISDVSVSVCVCPQAEWLRIRSASTLVHSAHGFCCAAPALTTMSSVRSICRGGPPWP